MSETGPFLTPPQEKILSWVIFGLIVVAFLALISLWAFSILLSFDDVRRELLVQHFPAFVGLPAAGAAAFILLFLFRQVSGPIELQLFGIKCKGAEGPAILWTILFAVMAAAIKLLW